MGLASVKTKLKIGTQAALPATSFELIPCIYNLGPGRGSSDTSLVKRRIRVSDTVEIFVQVTAKGRF